MRAVGGSRVRTPGRGFEKEQLTVAIPTEIWQETENLALGVTGDMSKSCFNKEQAKYRTE